MLVKRRLLTHTKSYIRDAALIEVKLHMDLSGEALLHLLQERGQQRFFQDFMR